MLNNASPGQPVYDPFAGSGTSLIAAETCGRISLLMELDPAYVDVAVTRWQAFTGEAAVLDGAGLTFEQARVTQTVEQARVNRTVEQGRDQRASEQAPGPVAGKQE